MLWRNLQYSVHLRYVLTFQSNVLFGTDVTSWIWQRKTNIYFYNSGATFYIKWKLVFPSNSEILFNANGFSASVTFHFTDIPTLPILNLCTQFYTNRYFYQELHLYTETKIPVLYSAWQKYHVHIPVGPRLTLGLHSWEFQQCRTTQEGVFLPQELKYQKCWPLKTLPTAINPRPGNIHNPKICQP